jgi:hypothetical protein
MSAIHVVVGWHNMDRCGVWCASRSTRGRRRGRVIVLVFAHEVDLLGFFAPTRTHQNVFALIARFVQEAAMRYVEYEVRVWCQTMLEMGRRYRVILVAIPPPECSLYFSKHHPA